MKLLREKIEIAVDPYFSSRSGAKFDCVNDVIKMVESECRHYAIQELKKLNNKWESRRLIGTVTARIDIDEVIARLKKERDQPNSEQ